jgi:hypothetical protein
MAISRRAIVLVLVSVFAASAARAQVGPPTAGSPPAAGAPATSPAAPPPAASPAPPPATSPTPPPATPPAPPPGSTAPVTPLSPTLAPSQAPAPPLALAERTAQEPQAPRPRPIYETTWFWAALGVVLITTTVILVVTLRDPRDPPATTFGNMHAF